MVVRGLIAQALKTGEGYDAKLRLMRADDEERVTRTKARCEFDERGKVTALFGVFQDITDSVRAQDALVEARRVAEAAAEAKTDFLANVSHELRTPLTSIIGFSAFLKTSPTLSDKERHYADRISAASNALLGVINDVLDYSKLEAGAVDLDAAPFDPRAMAESAAALVGYQCAEKGLALAIEAAPDVPTALLGDELRLRQVTLNFLSNAVKFTEVGQIAVGLSMDGRRLRVSVADTGIGIAARRRRPAVRAVHPGRRLDDPPVRRHRSGSGDLDPFDRDDARRDRRRKPARRRARPSGSVPLDL